MNNIAAAVLLGCLPLAASAKPPELGSAFPLVVSAGQQADVLLHGKFLDGAYAVRFDCPAIEGDILRTEGSEVTVAVRVRPNALEGFHILHLITPRGLSSPVALWVNGLQPGSNNARSSDSLPRFLNGRLTQPGKPDRYRIEGRRGQPLRIEVISGTGLVETNAGAFTHPELKVYRPVGSWLDPDEHPQLLCESFSRTFEFPRLTFTEHHQPRLVCDFPEDGPYLVEVSAWGGSGGADYVYALRLSSAQDPEAAWIPRTPAHGDPNDLPPISFTRRLDPDRLRLLRSRSAGIASAPDHPVQLLSKSEPNNTRESAQPVRAPVLIEGRIAQPGDVDLFRVEVSAGEALAFEVETPELPPPYFNPRLAILDSGGRELANNIYRKIDGDGDDWVKSMEPKTLYKFPAAGSYFVQIGDLTGRNGGSDFAYRLMIRPQVPHVGRVTIRRMDMGFVDRTEDHLNVEAGSSQRLVILAEMEEGLDADLAVDFNNLPQGAHASPTSFVLQKGLYMTGSEVYETRWEGLQNIHREWYRPRRRVIPLLLSASPDSPAKAPPRLARLVVTPTPTPSVEGTPGRPLATQELPVMVVAKEGKSVSKADLPTGK